MSVTNHCCSRAACCGCPPPPASLANLPLTPLHLSVLARQWQQALLLAYPMMGLGLAAALRILLLHRR